MKKALLECGTKVLDFSKSQVQRDFMACRTRYQLFAGGFGCGKTTACCAKGLILSALIPNNVGAVVRSTYPELRDTTRRAFLEMVPPHWVARWQEAHNELTLRNGSKIIFRHFETGKIKVGVNLGWFLIDQAEEADQDIFLGLQGRLRLNVPRQYGLLAMNPNGEDWQHKTFVLGDKARFACFNATSYEAAVFHPEGYIADMLRNYPPEWVDRFILGKWTKESGIIFHELDEDVHVLDPFPIPVRWPRGRGLDWGVDAPATCVFVAQSPDGKYYVYDEYGESERTPEEHAASILERSAEGESYQCSVIDATAFRRDSDMKTVADKYRLAGLPCRPATQDQMSSILHVKRLLKTGRLFFLRGKTVELLKEAHRWRWGAKVKGKEVPARGADHYLDALRYILHWLDRRDLAGGGKAVEAEARRPMGGTLTFEPAELACDQVTGLPA